MKLLIVFLLGVSAVLASAAQAQNNDDWNHSQIRHVLLLSIDGMHAVDFYNCAHGLAGINNGNPYCPSLASLGQTAINYVAVTSSKPSDSFPGLTAIVSGSSPRPATPWPSGRQKPFPA